MIPEKLDEDQEGAQKSAPHDALAGPFDDAPQYLQYAMDVLCVLLKSLSSVFHLQSNLCATQRNVVAMVDALSRRREKALHDEALVAANPKVKKRRHTFKSVFQATWDFSQLPRPQLREYQVAFRPEVFAKMEKRMGNRVIVSMENSHYDAKTKMKVRDAFVTEYFEKRLDSTCGAGTISGGTHPPTTKAEEGSSSPGNRLKSAVCSSEKKNLANPSASKSPLVAGSSKLSTLSLDDLTTPVVFLPSSTDKQGPLDAHSQKLLITVRTAHKGQLDDAIQIVSRMIDLCGGESDLDSDAPHCSEATTIYYRCVTEATESRSLEAQLEHEESDSEEEKKPSYVSVQSALLDVRTPFDAFRNRYLCSLRFDLRSEQLLELLGVGARTPFGGGPATACRSEVAEKLLNVTRAVNEKALEPLLREKWLPELNRKHARLRGTPVFTLEYDARYKSLGLVIISKTTTSLERLEAEVWGSLEGVIRELLKEEGVFPPGSPVTGTSKVPVTGLPSGKTAWSKSLVTFPAPAFPQRATGRSAWTQEARNLTGTLGQEQQDSSDEYESDAPVKPEQRPLRLSRGKILAHVCRQKALHETLQETDEGNRVNPDTQLDVRNLVCLQCDTLHTWEEARKRIAVRNKFTDASQVTALSARTALPPWDFCCRADIEQAVKQNPLREVCVNCHSFMHKVEACPRRLRWSKRHAWEEGLSIIGAGSGGVDETGEALVTAGPKVLVKAREVPTTRKGLVTENEGEEMILKLRKLDIPESDRTGDREETGRVLEEKTRVAEDALVLYGARSAEIPQQAAGLRPLTAQVLYEQIDKTASQLEAFRESALCKD